MSADPDLSPEWSELEERAWQAVEEADRALTAAFVLRAARLARAVALCGRAGRGDFASCEAAATLRVADVTAKTVMAEAGVLAEQPTLAGAMADGRVGLQHGRVLIGELMGLQPEEAEVVLADVLPRVGARTPAQVRGITRRALIRLWPAAAADRRVQARKRVGVWIHPEPDGLACLRALLPAEDATTLMQALTEQAAARPAAEGDIDSRRIAALLADVLGVPATDPRPAGDTPRRRGCRGARVVDVTVPVSVALGLSDAPGELHGYGPIDAELTRLLVTDAVLRKVCVDERTGQVLAVASTTHRVRTAAEARQVLLDMVAHPTLDNDELWQDRYRPGAALARHVRTRDVSCVFPGCSVPAWRCDLDHRVPWPQGSTSPDNLAALSRHHHRAKQAGWTPSAQPDGSTTWRSPCGRHYVRPCPHEPPPPLHRTALPPLPSG